MISKIAVVFVLASFYPAEAQQPTKAIPRIGLIISTGTPETPSPSLEAFRQGLRDRGFVEDKNVLIERRYAEGRLDRMAPFVHELVQQKVNVILAATNVVIRAAQAATKTIPIVMISSIDPIKAGYVQSFARPGGNITGIAWISRDLAAKRMELLKALLPKISQVGVLWDSDAPGPKIAIREYLAAAEAFKLEMKSFAVRGVNPDFAEVFHAAIMARTPAVIVVGNPMMTQHMKTIFELATKNHILTMAEDGRYVEAGGLISYGANLAELFMRSAEHVADILKGAKPGDLPVKVSSKFELFINLNTAKQLGVVMPREILVLADKVTK